MTEDLFFLARGSSESFEGARISRIMTHLHKAIFHITTGFHCAAGW